MAACSAPFLAGWRHKNLEESEQDGTAEIETTIDKILLTSLQSEFETLKIFSLDAEKLAR